MARGAAGAVVSARPLVIYHGPGCPDGFTAAWVAWRWFRERRGVTPELHAAQYGDPPPDVLDRDVLIVDFSYPRPTLLEMWFGCARSLRVFDHHKTALHELADLPFCTFDEARSGAGLAWDALFHALPRPWLVDYVEDRDLWRWRLEGSREVSAALATYEHDLETWDRLGRSDGGTLNTLMEEGRAILRYQARVVRSHVEKARRCRLAGVEVPVVNATTMISEIGNELAQGAPFAAMWFEAQDGSFVYSLRSRAEHPDHADVSEVAKRFGGGGHRHAAGFKSATLVHEVIG